MDATQQSTYGSAQLGAYFWKLQLITFSLSTLPLQRVIVLPAALADKL